MCFCFVLLLFRIIFAWIEAAALPSVKSFFDMQAPRHPHAKNNYLTTVCVLFFLVCFFEFV